MRAALGRDASSPGVSWHESYEGKPSMACVGAPSGQAPLVGRPTQDHPRGGKGVPWSIVNDQVGNWKSLPAQNAARGSQHVVTRAQQSSARAGMHLRRTGPRV